MSKRYMLLQPEPDFLERNLDDLWDKRELFLVAIPESLYDVTLEKSSYRKRGELSGVSSMDFVSGNYHQPLLFPIGGLSQGSSCKSRSELLNLLLKTGEEIELDRELMEHVLTRGLWPKENFELIDFIADTQLVDGNIYIMKHSPIYDPDRDKIFHLLKGSVHFGDVEENVRDLCEKLRNQNITSFFVIDEKLPPKFGKVKRLKVKLDPESKIKLSKAHIYELKNNPDLHLSLVVDELATSIWKVYKNYCECPSNLSEVSVEIDIENVGHIKTDHRIFSVKGDEGIPLVLEGESFISKQLEII